METAEGRRLARGLTLMLADDYDTTCSIYSDSESAPTTGCLVSTLSVNAQLSARAPTPTIKLYRRLLDLHHFSTTHATNDASAHMDRRKGLEVMPWYIPDRYNPSDQGLPRFNDPTTIPPRIVALPETRGDVLHLVRTESRSAAQKRQRYLRVLCAGYVPIQTAPYSV